MDAIRIGEIFIKNKVADYLAVYDGDPLAIVIYFIIFTIARHCQRGPFEDNVKVDSLNSFQVGGVNK
ncbi:hypothetical protein D3C85_1562840 [compost metagenome]